MTAIRTYSELIRLETFAERYEYLKLKSVVGRSTFGFDRFLNQQFYTSRQWKQVRSSVITRDLGNDLAVEGNEIFEKAIIHHMNPMTPEQIEEGSADILDPEFLITTTHQTHNAIHYGDDSKLRQPLQERRPGDTRLW